MWGGVGCKQAALMSDLPKTGNIRVSVRLRPLNEREIEAGSECVWSCSEDSLVLSSQYGAFRGASSCAMSFGRGG